MFIIQQISYQVINNQQNYYHLNQIILGQYPHQTIMYNFWMKPRQYQYIIYDEATKRTEKLFVQENCKLDRLRKWVEDFFKFEDFLFVKSGKVLLKNIQPSTLVSFISEKGVVLIDSSKTEEDQIFTARLHSVKAMKSTQIRKELQMEFVCPISQQIFKEPVIMDDGYTYQKKFIQKWLENKKTSPLTRKPIKVENSSIKNFSVRNIVPLCYQYFDREQKKNLNMERFVFCMMQAVNKQMIFIKKFAQLLQKTIDQRIEDGRSIFQNVLNQVKIFSSFQSTHYEFLSKVRDQFSSGNQSFLHSYEKHLQSLQMTLYDFKSVHEQIAEESSIVESIKDAKRLLQFFEEKVGSVKILFKASKDNFSLQKYWQKCGGQQNTLIICQTKSNNILGGFSPLSHLYNEEQNRQNGWSADDSKRSFLFSLTNQDKFKLKNSKHAVLRWKDKSHISFGSGELRICHESNKNNCRSNVNQNYFNEDYSDSKESYLKLNGNKTATFTTLEWQVWKISFLNQQKI